MGANDDAIDRLHKAEKSCNQIADAAVKEETARRISELFERTPKNAPPPPASARASEVKPEQNAINGATQLDSTVQLPTPSPATSASHISTEASTSSGYSAATISDKNQQLELEADPQITEIDDTNGQGFGNEKHICVDIEASQNSRYPFFSSPPLLNATRFTETIIKCRVLKILARGLTVEDFDFFQIINIWSSAIALGLVLSCLLVYLLQWTPLRDVLGFEDYEDDNARW
jgi:hypothetical protein